MRDLVRMPDGEQDVTGIQRPGCARRTGGRLDAILVEKQEEALPFYALEAKMHVAGEAMQSVAVQYRMGNRGKTADQFVTKRFDLLRVFGEVRSRFFESRGKRRDARDVLRACTTPFFLCAALNEATTLISSCAPSIV